MIKTKSEKGKEIKLWVEGKKMMGSMEGLIKKTEIKEAKVQGFDCISFGSIKYNGEKTRVLTKLNDDIKIFLNEAEKEIEAAKEEERERELKIKITETRNSGAWVTQDLLLEPEEKLLSKDQQEKLEELRLTLGEQQLFAGAPKYIKAKELPVEKGEEYTLTEIMEMVKKESKSWERKQEQEQKEEKHYQECLQKAKETGKNVKLESFSTHCNDNNKECSTDIITVYITPSGQEKKERTHTY